MRAAALVSVLWLVCTTIAKASELARVSFLESTPGFYLRPAPSKTLQDDIFTSSDVSAAISVLLGSSPPSPISDESIAKLNQLLVPNPFQRPHAVLLLSLKEYKPGTFQTTFSERQIGGGTIVAQRRQLQGESTTSPLLISEDVQLLFLSTSDDRFLKSTITDREFHEMASFLGGSYVETKEPLKGCLSFMLSNGDAVTLDLEKEGHLNLALKLSTLLLGVEDAILGRDRISGGLIVGALILPMELYEAPDSSFTSTEASQILHLVVTKLFKRLDRALNGGLLGVVVESENEVLTLKVKSGPSRLELLQTSSSTTTSTVAEVLTETIIAYITGILLIVALIIGVCFLSKMPLTRDTLLYSGVKLD